MPSSDFCEAKHPFASSKPPFCFILKTLELRANFHCITMQNRLLNYTHADIFGKGILSLVAVNNMFNGGK